MHYTIVLYKFCDQVQFTHVQLQNHFGLNFLIRKQTQFSWMSQQWVGVGVNKVKKKRVGGLFWVTVLWCINNCNNDNNKTAFMLSPHFPTSAVVLQHKCSCYSQWCYFAEPFRQIMGSARHHALFLPHLIYSIYISFYLSNSQTATVCMSKRYTMSSGFQSTVSMQHSWSTMLTAL